MFKCNSVFHLFLEFFFMEVVISIVMFVTVDKVIYKFIFNDLGLSWWPGGVRRLTPASFA